VITSIVQHLKETNLYNITKNAVYSVAHMVEIPVQVRDRHGRYPLMAAERQLLLFLMKG
jgi:hypothetical protein